MDTTTDVGYEAQQQQQQQQPYYELYTSARFITGLILYPIICLFGLTGNALIIVVLAHKMALSSTDVLLAALAISDAVKLINDLLYSTLTLTYRSRSNGIAILIPDDLVRPRSLTLRSCLRPYLDISLKVKWHHD